MSRVALGEITSLVMGQAPPGSTCNIEGIGTPFVKAGQFGDRKPIINEWTTKPLKVAQPGDVLICVVGATSGKLNLGTDCAIGRSVAAVRPESDRLHQLYLYYFLSTWTARLLSGSQGSAQGVITKRMIQELRIPLPSLDEQRRIASILDKAKAIKRQRQDAIRLMEDFLHSAFIEMFGDPVMNPKQWPVRRLGETLTFVTSGSRGWAKYYVPSGARFIRSLDVQMNSISDTDAVFVNPPDSAETRRTQVQADDVLLTITGSKIGRVAPFEPSIGKAYVSQHVAILRLDSSIRPYYLSMFLSDARGGQHQIRRMQYGQTKPGLNLEQIRSFEIPCPPPDMQDRFVALWTRFKKHGENHATAEKHTNDLFNSLVQRAFRGEL